MTSSVKKRPIRFTLLPSLLALSLVLSACQDTSLPNESDVQEGTQTSADAINDDGIEMNADAVTDETQMDKMSDEEKMIANLSRYRWTLMSVTDKGAQPLTMLMDIKDQVRLSFSQYQGENTLSYSVGCNTMSAGYQLQGHTLTIDDGMSTKISCGELDKAENSLSQLMQGESQLTLVTASSDKDDAAKDDSPKSDKPILTQVTSDAATLIWEGKLTPQAKYNRKGETVFWAVSSKMIPCADNDSEMCLQVKPITYDNQGIKTSEGKWAVFTGEIDGYQHDGMHDEVLRLQRYQLDSDESVEGEEYAYMLDAVIESAVAE
ncbi:META domain-containing protein [Psychrobacter aquimaris]|uniref:META domain-containing protein n=1 Tax=Psychrobacter aquimaris TaxID=292733 RepID=UPI003FD63537